jgi:hypothetical protein
LRRKKSHGGDRKSEKIKGPKGTIDSTATEIGKEEGCGPTAVKRHAKMVQHIAEACGCGLGFLRDPILQERIKYSKKLLDELIYVGAGGCKNGRPDGHITEPASLETDGRHPTRQAMRPP